MAGAHARPATKIFVDCWLLLHAAAGCCLIDRWLLVLTRIMKCLTHSSNGLPPRPAAIITSHHTQHLPHTMDMPADVPY
jgi:hypothetical protein